jgi:peptidylprolyl isomerase
MGLSKGSLSVPRRVHIWLAVPVSAAVLALAGCGSSSTSSSGGTSSTTTTTATTTGPTGTGTPAAIASIPTQDRSPAGTAGKAPTVVVPPGPPPTQLESADLIVGKGAAAKSGDSVTVQYVLATYSTRKVIQSSWGSQPFDFTLGVGQVIPGWDQGVVGMKVGGRRELIIPPSLGYGSQSPGTGIAPNDTLVFVIDLVSFG